MAVRDIVQSAAGVSTGNAWDIGAAIASNGSASNDLTTIVSTNTINSLGSTIPTSLTFSPDGNYMYVLSDGSNIVYGYSLASPWRINPVTAFNDFSVGSQETNPNSVVFSSDGTNMYVCGITSDRVYQYTLSTAWDLSTASYTGNSLVAGDSLPKGLALKLDGTKLYICGDDNNAIREFTLSTPFDISTASFSYSLSIGSQANTPGDISFTDDGLTLYVIDFGDTIYRYDLTTAWDLSTASYSSNSTSITTLGDRSVGLHVSGDGGLIFTLMQQDTSGNPVNPMRSFIFGGFSVASEQTTPNDLTFSPDGTKMYIIGLTGDYVSEYSLSTAWDIYTASFVQSVSVSTQEADPHALFFKPDGTKMYITGITGDEINEYSLSTAWDISTLSFVQLFSISAQDGQSAGLFFHPDGTKMYVSGYANDRVYEYDLSTAWDISTASYVQFFSVVSQSTAPTGLFFKSDGTVMFIACQNTRAIYQYELSTAWDVSTASYQKKLGTTTVTTGIAFSSDGTIMFTTDSGTDRVRAYTL